MQIVGEYSSTILNGAGCGGAQSGDQVFLTAGISASGAGFDQSTFTVYAFDDTAFSADSPLQQNYLMPKLVFKDASNTNTIGNIEGTRTSDTTGQIPQFTARRDSHGAVITGNGKYLHVCDRIQNEIEVFDTRTHERVNTYDLVSLDGKSGRSGPSAACRYKSVTDDAGLVPNDPAPDLMDATPDGKHILVALRGPVPVTVGHSTQGSCPGVGVVEITEGGKSGRLINVLRATNTENVETATVSVTGGHNYEGLERSDVHGVIAVRKN